MFSNWIDILTRKFFVVGLVYCSLFSSISGFPVDASRASVPTTVITKNISRHCQMSSEGQNHPWLRTTALCYISLFYLFDSHFRLLFRFLNSRKHTYINISHIFYFFVYFSKHEKGNLIFYLLITV